jgi:diguanylate cyclase (GGDEF)-like protein/PAS domain S-box-containing protein
MNENPKIIYQILEHLPFPACQVDSDLHLQYANKAFVDKFYRADEPLLGASLEYTISSKYFFLLEQFLYEALNGEYGCFVTYDSQEKAAIEISILPHFATNGLIDGALIFSYDIADKIRLLQAKKSLTDHLAALDAHAIVASTDANGIITSVNDKFCEISQYSREELYGQSHRIVKSGLHSIEFYEDLWETISNGKIWQGDICNRAKDGSLYWVHSTIVPFLDSNDIPFKYISIRADITKLKDVEQEAQHLSLHDSLTNLPNRRLFNDRLNQSILNSSRTNQYCALISIDLDGFKSINDINGHSVGDLLLCKAARRLQSGVRDTDTVARIGGDEFLIVLNNLVPDDDQAIQSTTDFCTRLQLSLCQPYNLAVRKDVDNDATIVTASIGIVLFKGDNITREELLQQADIAMYCAKSNGRNQFVFFEPSQQEQVKNRFTVEAELRSAISKNELLLYYQPIVNHLKEMIGMEALLRWQHPTKGLISPDCFIPIAEQSGLIIPIGQWVLESACATLKKWQSDIKTSSWTLAVNVSAKQFNAPDFTDNVLFALKKSGANPCGLCIELTETALLKVFDHDSLGKIQTLRENGIILALDDFGTGYSSLSYLTALPLDRLKIDKSFVHALFDDQKKQIIIKAIILIAKSMNLQVIAEGVETKQQFQHLESIGCEVYQGYFFGRPAPLDWK